MHGGYRGGGRGTLVLRLALAFVVVALAAVGLFAGLTLAIAEGDVSALVSQQRADVTQALEGAAVAAYRRNGTWSGTDLTPALALAAETGVGLKVLDQSGHQVAASKSPASRAAGSPPAVAPVTVDGARVGSLVLRFADAGLAVADDRLRTALARAVGAGGVLAALLALAVAVVVSRRITRPVLALTAAARAMDRGDREARVGLMTAPGELGELALAFDRMADSLDREDRLRRDLVADVTHEIRTPVAVLQASTEALMDGLTQADAETLSSLHDEVLRLRRMVEDLQTLASAEAAGLALAKAPVDLARIAAEAADSLEARFADAGLRLQRHLEPVVVLGDRTRLHQVVANLLTNAVKFTPAGGQVELEVAASGTDARLCVTDTGVGIPEQEQGRVFERFWRGRAGASVAGSGIGLAVVAELARAHGGRVTLDSEPGRGTAIGVVLPRA
ncbi:MAG: sensor histidine kinase [Acidimicrobiales bacterium]